MTLTVSSSSSTFACKSPSISHPWLPFAHLFIEKNSPTLPKTTRLPRRLFWPCPPKVIKNTNHGKPVDILSTGMIASTRIHKLIALSVRRPPFPMISSAAMSFFTLIAPSLSPSKTPTKNRAWESVLESLFWSCQVLYRCLATLGIVPRPGGFPRPFAYHYHLDAIPSRWPLPHPQTKLEQSPWPVPGMLTCFSTLLLQVCRACKVVGMERSRSGSTRCHSSATKGEGEEEKYDLGQDVTMPGPFEKGICSSTTVYSLDRGSRKKSGWFSAASPM